jgi:ATP-binding cassette subfamily F protein uup
MLVDYTGTLLLVSHDRAFLDNVVTQTIAAEGKGQWHDYVGGYTDWLRQRALPRAASTGRAPATPAPAAAPVAAAPKRKLSFKEQRELESLPADIEKLEREQLELTEKSYAPDYHKAGAEQMRRDRERATELAALIASRMERWEALEALASGIAAGRS